MAYRIGIAAFLQESNSFSPRRTEAFDFNIHAGPDILPCFENTNSEIMGFLDACTQWGWEPVLLMTASANSGGPLSAECFDGLASQFLSLIRAQELDALLIALHGAMATELFPSGDAEFALRVRQIVGPRVPIVVTHDFHANVTASLLKQVDGVVGYRTYPHADQRETGRRAASILRRLFAGERAVRFYLPVPMLLSAEASSTSEEPMRGVIEQLSTQFNESQGIYASLFCVQPWLDFVPVGGSVVVTQFGEDDSTPAKMKAVAKLLWEGRHGFRVPWVQPECLLDCIRRISSRPVLVSEAYDAPPAGAAGDHTGFLATVLPEAENFKCCAYLVDPKFVMRAQAAGRNATVEGEIGAQTDPRFSRPLPICATVESLSDGTFTAKTASAHGRQFSMGPTAVLALGKMRIVVSSKAVMLTVDPELYRSQGIEPSGMDIVGVKSALQFRFCYEEISRSVLNLDLPGAARGRLEAMPFEKINRPIFPLNDFEWTIPEPVCLRTGQG